MENENIKQVSKKAEKLNKLLDERVKNGEARQIIDESLNWWYTCNKSGELQSVCLLLLNGDEGTYTVDTNEDCLSLFEENVYAQWDLSINAKEVLTQEIMSILKEKELIK